MSKLEAARKLARIHYDVEDGMVDVYRLAGANETDADPIVLLEVNRNTVPAGILPLPFGALPAQGIPNASVIVEVTPESSAGSSPRNSRCPTTGGSRRRSPARASDSSGGWAVARPDEWGRAFAAQARADLGAYFRLAATDLPECQKLHFLQMACETLAKAYLCHNGSDPSDVQKSHAYAASVLPPLLRDHLQSLGKKTSVIRDFIRLTAQIGCRARRMVA